MTLAEIEQLRAKGWHFDFTGDREGWMCQVVGLGLAHGHGSGETLEKAAEWAMKTAGTMEDDPQVLIKAHCAKLEKLAKEIFGETVFQGIEPVESAEPGEPLRIALSVAPTIEVKAYMDQEMAFIHRLIEEFPMEVSRAVILEVDWPEEKA